MDRVTVFPRLSKTRAMFAREPWAPSIPGPTRRQNQSHRTMHSRPQCGIRAAENSDISAAAGGSGARYADELPPAIMLASRSNTAPRSGFDSSTAIAGSVPNRSIRSMAVLIV